MYTVDEVRQLFLDYFQGKGHTLIPSSSLIPATDPTLLLTTAGMVQFVPYFLGRATPPARRMTSAQKCFRTTDIDAVGDYKHLTFFEMLGNFSVGDYFKREAIAYGWELLTQRLKLPKERLYVTIYLDDDEAFRFWHEEQGVPAERIYRYGKSANWWGPPGAQGPCGPCSEMHYDFGAELGCGPLAKPAAVTAWEAEATLRSFGSAQDRQSQGDPSTSSGRAVLDQPGCHPNCDRCERFMEVWNLVFMQFYQDTEKKLTPLPAPNIDTGMGLERIVTVLQGKRTVYDTDIFQPLLQRVAELCDKQYGQDKDIDYAIRIVAEHARGAAFLIADGVVPGNEKRGYVLRRIIRRAVRHGRKLGLAGTFLGKVAEPVIDHMGHVYPELRQTREFVLRVLQIEEERFGETLKNGLDLLEGYIRCLKDVPDQELTKLQNQIMQKHSEDVLKGTAATMLSTELSDTISSISAALTRGNAKATETKNFGYMEAYATLSGKLTNLQRAAGFVAKPRGNLQAIHISDLRSDWTAFYTASRHIPGELAFRLYDTYGFPPEVSEDIAKEHRLTVGMEGFEWEMGEQRKRARSATRMGGGHKAEAFAYDGLGVGGTAFVGYERMGQQTVVLALVADDESVQSAQAGQDVEVVLRETPFYAEMGGQVGDAGVLAGPFGRVEVTDTRSPASEVTVHRGRVAEGAIAVGETVYAKVDVGRRLDTARNHTTTHMLHAALRQVLGAHVRQAGSLVAHDRLRFDFSHVQALTPEELQAVERLVNEKVREDLPVGHHAATYTQAVQEGALAFFGETYGAKVRVVEVGDCSPPPSPSPVKGEGSAEAHTCFSKEVCGGTHLQRTGQIGLCLVLGEQSIGAGTRRIEAVTGRHAEALARERIAAVERLASSLATTPAELPNRVAALQAELSAERERAANLERDLLHNEVGQALDRYQATHPEPLALERSEGLVEGRAANGHVVTLRVEHTASADSLREAADWAKTKLGSAVVALGAVVKDQPVVVVAATPDQVKRGVHAGKLAKELGAAMGGGGGGRPESAQAGGKASPDRSEGTAKLDEALRLLPKLLEKMRPAPRP